MSKFLIEDVNVGVSGGGMACGPVGGNTIVEVRVRRDDKVMFYSMAVVEGPLFYMSENSTFDKQISEDDDEFFYDLQDKQFAGYDSYGECYDDLKNGENDSELAFLMKYICYLAQVDGEELTKILKASVGKHTGEFEIPMSDMEEEYLDMMDAEEE